jgi:thymidylate synthase
MCRQYLDLLEDILENGEIREDRTGTGTKSVFGRQLRFNLEKGFPLVTTKKMGLKSIYSELLWFLEGSTDERRLAEIQHGSRDVKNKTIWTENALADYWVKQAKFVGDLGNIYGSMWRKWPVKSETNTVIQKKNKEPDDAIKYDNHRLVPVISDDITGKVVKTSSGYEGLVIEKLDVRNKNTYYKVQFINTGNIVEVSRPNIRNGAFSDIMEKTQSNVGVFGKPIRNIESKTNLDNRIYTMWDNMISRCYDKNHPSYKFYGEKGVTVSTAWQNYSIFEHSIKNVPGFRDWCDNKKMELDKDYYGANQYSESTCIFIPKKYNLKLSKQEKSYGLMLDRKNLYIDQIKDVIKSLKENPWSRRHLVIAYNPAEVSKMCLPPCHIFFQFWVSSNRKLSCQFYMRSGDAFLGIPYNIASYALLTYMIAQVCDLEVGDLVMSLGDAHIYLNHIEQVNEQLHREPYPLPTLWIDPTINDMDDFALDSIKIINYQCHPRIIAPMAV